MFLFLVIETRSPRFPRFDAFALGAPAPLVAFRGLEDLRSHPHMQAVRTGSSPPPLENWASCTSSLVRAECVRESLIVQVEIPYCRIGDDQRDCFDLQQV